jgi:hypothetical protein
MRTMYDGSLLRGWRNPPFESAPQLGQYQGDHVTDIETANAFSAPSRRRSGSGA